jgi:hypothetical protein
VREREKERAGELTDGSLVFFTYSEGSSLSLLLSKSLLMRFIKSSLLLLPEDMETRGKETSEEGQKAKELDPTSAKTPLQAVFEIKGSSRT